jgi:hypothetical protein
MFQLTPRCFLDLDSGFGRPSDPEPEHESEYERALTPRPQQPARRRRRHRGRRGRRGDKQGGVAKLAETEAEELDTCFSLERRFDERERRERPPRCYDKVEQGGADDKAKE